MLQTPPVEASMSNEWDVLKHQFDALVRDESSGAECIDEILDAQFRRRFAELIDRVAAIQSRLGTPPGSVAFRKGHFR
jgi:hypothetical protein